MTSSTFTTAIAGQSFTFVFHGSDSSVFDDSLNNLGDLLKAALETQVSLSLQRPENLDSIPSVNLEDLRQWLREGIPDDISATDVLSSLLSETDVKITEFAIASTGAFTITLKVKFDTPFVDEDLPPAIRQIIQGPEIGLGMTRIV